MKNTTKKFCCTHPRALEVEEKYMPKSGARSIRINVYWYVLLDDVILFGLVKRPEYRDKNGCGALKVSVHGFD